MSVSRILSISRRVSPRLSSAGGGGGGGGLNNVGLVSRHTTTVSSMPQAPLNLPGSAFWAVSEIALSKASASSKDVFTNCIFGGVMLGLGGVCTFVIVAGGSPKLAKESPGLHKLLGGLVFPWGMTLIATTGAGLATGNFFNVAMPLITHPGHAAASLRNAMRVVVASLAGNVVGAVGTAFFIEGAGIVQADSPAGQWAARLSETKCSLSFGAAFAKAVACNFMVNTAIVFGAGQTTPGAKIAAVYIPIAVFVILGLEHSIANMTLLPLGMLLGANITPLDIMGNLVPVTLGNAVGAVLLLIVQSKALPPARAAPLTLATAWAGRVTAL